MLQLDKGWEGGKGIWALRGPRSHFKSKEPLFPKGGHCQEGDLGYLHGLGRGKCDQTMSTNPTTPTLLASRGICYEATPTVPSIICGHKARADGRQWVLESITGAGPDGPFHVQGGQDQKDLTHVFFPVGGECPLFVQLFPRFFRPNKKTPPPRIRRESASRRLGVGCSAARRLAAPEALCEPCALVVESGTRQCPLCRERFVRRGLEMSTEPTEIVSL